VSPAFNNLSRRNITMMKNKTAVARVRVPAMVFEWVPRGVGHRLGGHTPGRADDVQVLDRGSKGPHQGPGKLVRERPYPCLTVRKSNRIGTVGMPGQIKLKWHRGRHRETPDAGSVRAPFKPVGVDLGLPANRGALELGLRCGRIGRVFGDNCEYRPRIYPGMNAWVRRGSL
jgi:hypothetical protein